MKKLLIAAAGLLLVLPVMAQVTVTNNGTLHLSNAGDLLFINGAFTNSSGAALTNNGSIYVRGNLTNHQPAIAAGTGTLYLDGTSAQQLLGTEAFRTFNLVTNNAAGITLSNNLQVTGTHTFDAGIITTSSTPNFLVYEAGAAYTGATDAKHVNGWVKKRGNTTFAFPVGNGNYLRPVEISNLATTSEFDARYRTVTTNATNVVDPIKIVNPNEFWTLNRISGGTAQVTLNWDHEKVNFPNFIVEDLRVSAYNSGWVNRGGSASGTTTSTGTITSDELNSFGSLVIGSTSFVIPLKFLDVTAKRRNNTTIVEWRTANEIDVGRYEVQKGSTPNAFVTVASVAATNRQDEQTYSMPDPLHNSGTVYYRIKSVDNSGAVKYSKVVSASLTAVAQPVLLTNPASTQLMLLVPAGHEAYQYSLSNAAGQLVRQGKVNKPGNLLTIELPVLAPGIYHLTLYYGGQGYHQKVVIQ